MTGPAPLPVDQTDPLRSSDDAPAGVGMDGGRLLGRLEEMAAISATPGPGVTRVAWSPEWRAATAVLHDWGQRVGARCWMDPVGNVIAEYPGSDSHLPPLVTGSHLDSVPGGGRLDGTYGVVAAWEVLASLAAGGRVLRHPVRAVAFVNEEGVVAPPYTGSRAVAGLLESDELDQEAGAPGSRSLRAVLESAGCQPADLDRARWTRPVAAFVELHVEQGPVLDRGGVSIGVVDAVTGQQRGWVRIRGHANHAGTTPMSMRHDALVAAAEVVLAVHALSGPGGCDVSTVGRLDVGPNVANVVPGEVDLTFDLRSTDPRRLSAALSDLVRRTAQIGSARRVEMTVDPLPPTAPVPADPLVRDAVRRAATSHGLPTLALASGAGHDCAIVAGLGPAGMIFVPSTGGISHHCSESTPARDLIDGARVLLSTLIDLDRTLP
ncbi:MAG: Zn-dependent hydrolase [Acidobacteriota bacterium]|nr:Zn-dependent hydrolase [Acidobacteriota bacterium]